MIDHTTVPEAGFHLAGPPVKVVQATWDEALGIEVDPDAGFFDLGATSAMIRGVVRVLRRRWHHLRVVDIFSHPTIRQLSVFLDDE